MSFLSEKANLGESSFRRAICQSFLFVAGLLLAGTVAPTRLFAQGSEPLTLDSTARHAPDEPPPLDLDGALPRSSLILVGSEAVDHLRSEQLLHGVTPGQALILRSASSLTPLIMERDRKGVLEFIPPQFLVVANSAMPFSQNNGALWAGTGLSTRTIIGFKLENARTRLIFAPELILSMNADWLLRHDFYAPDVPPDRSQFDLPYYVGAFTIDQPMRFGNKPIGRLDLGETTALVTVRRMEIGFSNENEWWGPGIRNAIVLSNNAPGFPHFFLRTGRPLNTPLGSIDMRWLVGGLKESPYFDTVSTNNVRSIASVAATLQTLWDPNLSLGFARSVYSTATGWGQVPWRWFDVFDRTSGTALRKVKKDQLFSLFTRWVFPADGVEVYGEWARIRLKPTLRDFFVAPNDTQGYTLGLQWRGAPWRGGDFRVQTEITQLEQSATFRDGPLPSWYTSTRVIQGYTNRGQMLGASIGPGASSQWVALDYLKSGWRLGTYLGRIRWNEDVHSNFGFPAYASYCNHDVSVLGGIRGARLGPFGTLTADLTIQDRLNAFFQNAGGCPYDRKLDIHNNTLSVSFSPGR